MTDPGRCGVVVGHGDFAAGLLAALESVAGVQDNLWPLSNGGLGREELEAAVRAMIAERAAGRDVVLFSDLSGGSCGLVCRRFLQEGLVRAIFYGVNLPLLVEFVFLQDEPFDTMIAAMVSKARTALGVER